jgi:hypothetical protein
MDATGRGPIQLYPSAEAMQIADFSQFSVKVLKALPALFLRRQFHRTRERSVKIQA